GASARLRGDLYSASVVAPRRTFLLGTVCLAVGALGESLARTPWELGLAGVVRSCAGFYSIPGLTILQRLVPGRTRFAYCTYLALVFGGQVMAEPVGALVAFNPSWRALYAGLGACGVAPGLGAPWCFPPARPPPRPG